MISIIITIFISWLIYAQVTKTIGESTFNYEVDDKFKICNEDIILNHYVLGTNYEGGKKAIKNKLLDQLQHLTFKKSGLITYQFIVNCEGFIGRLRGRSTDLNLRNIKVHSNKLRKLEEAIHILDDWNPAKNEYKSYDSYFIINFKIRNNKIIDIF